MRARSPPKKRASRSPRDCNPRPARFFLEDPEEEYAAEAKRFVDAGDYIGAASKAAYAIVLRKIKSKELGTLRDDLKNYAMETPSL